MKRLTLCLILTSSVVVAAERGPAPVAEFVPGWVLVRLERPLEEKAPDGSFSRITALPALNALVQERGVSKIEYALPVSMLRPRSPAALSRQGLDRLYKFHEIGRAHV